jgi:hypothetical protein
MISNSQVTTYAKNNFGVTQITLKPSDPHQAVTPGDFYELDINGGGASGYSDNITFCNSFALVCRNTYDVLTGNKIINAQQGDRRACDVEGALQSFEERSDFRISAELGGVYALAGSNVMSVFHWSVFLTPKRLLCTFRDCSAASSSSTTRSPA